MTLSDQRYTKVGEMLRGLVRRTPECALHVHVGVSDGEDAVRILNGMREYVPLFVALAANSPFWFGVDSGMASARAALVRGYPRHGIPRAFHDYGDYLATLDGYERAFGIADSSLMWWDVRPRPTLGTVELRGMDSQSSLRHVAALTAFAQALSYAIADSRRDTNTSDELLAESAFVAGRDGIAGRILHNGALQAVPGAVAETLDWVRPYARARGIDDGLEDVEWLVEGGGGAARQRRVHARGGMSELLPYLVSDSSPDRS
jgi:carboxylate-amine ligase